MDISPHRRRQPWLKCMKMDEEVTLFLPGRAVTLVLVCFTEPIGQYCPVLFANVCDT